MIQLHKIIVRTEAILESQGAALNSRQIKALAQALVEEINREISNLPITVVRERTIVSPDCKVTMKIGEEEAR